MTRYYIRLPNPALARGTEPQLSFQSAGADGLAKELQDALRTDTLFQRWRSMQEAPDEIDDSASAIDKGASVRGEQSHTAIDLVVNTTLSSTLLRQRLRWLAGSHWQLHDVR
ncbi:hypothetical protein [Pseudomarimonas arenosa]|uniref:Uncharacterized protein n=1 Tax=Pseudomarimonas arenosa TaxID=2774145 RepID=A0AAW3ZPK1_9GAMM|nr:hypothetical protein [Pseudomarimonas arenosa]MBD8527434.1 hypothetical protein [Pseudomarimonas arenosa]